MRPTIRLSQAYLDERGWSLAEGAYFLELDQARAVPAGDGDVCPQCGRPHAENQGDVFVADSATATSEHEHGRMYVLCICGAMYWYAAVDDLIAPTEEARVRAASASRTPSVVEKIAVTEEIAVVLGPESGTPQSLSTRPPDDSFPPGRFLMTPPSRHRYHRKDASRFFVVPPVPPPGA
jgi:hypothetical protein